MSQPPSIPPRCAKCATPAAFEAEIKAEAPYWEKLVRDSGAKVE